MILQTHKSSPGANLSYVVADSTTRSGLVVDPPPDIAPLLALARADEVRIEYVVNTHGHADHTGGNRALVAVTGARVAAHRASRVPKDLALDEGSVVQLGELSLRVLFTPGHSPDSICLSARACLWTGDTLFVGECGRTDLPGGDAGLLYDSLFEKILKLQDSVRIFPGHDYGATASSTLGEQRRTNYVLRPRTREEFIGFMAEP